MIAMEAGNCVEKVTKSSAMTVPQHLPIVPIIQCNDGACLDEKQTVNPAHPGKSRGKRQFYKFQSLSYGELRPRSENVVEHHCVDSQDRRNKCDTNNNSSGNTNVNSGGRNPHLTVTDCTGAMSDDSDSDIESSKARNLLVLPRLSITRRRTFGQQTLEISQNLVATEKQNRRHSWIW